MPEEIYRAGSQNRKRSPQEIKKMVKKMRASYKKGDQIKISSDIQHTYDETQAVNELEKSLENIEGNGKSK